MNRVVLAVDRQDRDTLPGSRLSDDAAGHDEDFLVGERNGFAMLDRGQRRLEPIGARRGAEHDVDVGIGRDRHQPLAAHAERETAGQS